MDHNDLAYDCRQRGASGTAQSLVSALHRLLLVLSIAFATVAIAGSTLTGQPGFGRTSAGLINLMLLIVPLIGLTIGAQAIVAEREDRLLDFNLRSQWERRGLRRQIPWRGVSLVPDALLGLRARGACWRCAVGRPSGRDFLSWCADDCCSGSAC